MHIVQYYNLRVRKVREIIDDMFEKHNIRYSGDFAVYCKGSIASKFINEIIQMIDANKCEKQYWHKKLDGKKDLIDLSIQKTIKKISTLVAAIKYYCKINYYSQIFINIFNY